MKLPLIALGVALGLLIAPLIWVGIFWLLDLSGDRSLDVDRDPF